MQRGGELGGQRVGASERSGSRRSVEARARLRLWLRRLRAACVTCRSHRRRAGPCPLAEGAGVQQEVDGSDRRALAERPRAAHRVGGADSGGAHGLARECACHHSRLRLHVCQRAGRRRRRWKRARERLARGEARVGQRDGCRDELGELRDERWRQPRARRAG
ncbi:hypothetical protein T492DRAFT_1066688 [Pavlovales sp. CCMP2436]|nr:hypothetical protein T492DRAFT_1066688 [Pavlovales sp. CCMP2436]